MIQRRALHLQEAVIGDRASASIMIGGHLDCEQYSALALLIAAEWLSLDWEGTPFEPDDRTPGTPLQLFAHEASGGCFEELESWCVETGLPFTRFSEGCPGVWGPVRVVYQGAGALSEYPCSDDDETYIARHTVEALGSLAAVTAYFDAADFTVPPLHVEGDAVPVAYPGTTSTVVIKGITQGGSPFSPLVVGDEVQDQDGETLAFITYSDSGWLGIFRAAHAGLHTLPLAGLRILGKTGA